MSARTVAGHEAVATHPPFRLTSGPESRRTIEGLVVLRTREQGGRLAMKTLDLPQHPQVLRRSEVVDRGKQPAQAECTRILDPALAFGPVEAHRHAHLAGPGLDAELGEEPQQGRVGAVVVDEEPGVDGDRSPCDVDEVRVRMATEPGGRLVERHVSAARPQDVRRGQAGDARTDHGHPARSRGHAEEVGHTC